MTEVVSGDLADGPVPVDPNVPDMREVLPVDAMMGLAAGIQKVLLVAQAHHAPVHSQADWVATFVAPELAARDSMIADLRADVEDNRLQLVQAGAALAESMAASVKVADQAVRLGELAHARAVVAHRLRTELWSAMADAERYRTLTEQRCPLGVHTGWFAPSAGRQHECPWCQILKLSGLYDASAAAVAAAADDDELDEPPAECSANGVEVVRDADGGLGCSVHGPHPHAGLPCPDCDTCQAARSDTTRYALADVCTCGHPLNGHASVDGCWVGDCECELFVGADPRAWNARQGESGGAS